MIPQNTKTARVALGARDKKIVDSVFYHIENWAQTETALEEYLQAVGFNGKKLVKQRKIASMIMIMERSFKGKYLVNERAHWQYISPPKDSPAYREGDMLSEKLERCSRPSSFKKKFDCIGHTDNFSRKHFEGTPLDFKGMLYLCMRDTNDNNKSWFYRNDKLVAEFIELALQYKRESVRSLSEKLSGRFSRNCQAAFRESVSSLLTTDTIHRIPIDTHSKTSKPAVCVTSETEGISDGNRKSEEVLNDSIASNCINKENDMAKSDGKFKGITASKVVEGLDIEVKEFSAYAVKKDAYGDSVVTGYELYKIWRDAVAANGLVKATMLSPTVAKASKDYMNMESIFKTFTQGYEAEDFPVFMDTIMREWSSLGSHLKDTKAWDTSTLAYPDIGILKYVLPKVLAWYEGYMVKAKENEQIKNLQEIAKIKAAAANTTNSTSDLQSSKSIVQSVKINKNAKSSVGYTYIGQGFKYAPNGTVNRTYEEDYAEAKKKGDTSMLELIMSALEKKAIDLNASLNRIETLVS